MRGVPATQVLTDRGIFPQGRERGRGHGRSSNLGSTLGKGTMTSRRDLINSSFLCATLSPIVCWLTYHYPGIRALVNPGSNKTLHLVMRSSWRSCKVLNNETRSVRAYPDSQSAASDQTRNFQHRKYIVRVVERRRSELGRRADDEPGELA